MIGPAVAWRSSCSVINVMASVHATSFGSCYRFRFKFWLPCCALKQKPFARPIKFPGEFSDLAYRKRHAYIRYIKRKTRSLQLPLMGVDGNYCQHSDTGTGELEQRGNGINWAGNRTHFIPRRYAFSSNIIVFSPLLLRLSVYALETPNTHNLFLFYL